MTSSCRQGAWLGVVLVLSGCAESRLIYLDGSGDVSRDIDPSTKADRVTTTVKESGQDLPKALFRIGCSDMTREGFLDGKIYDKIAACSGGWSVAGLSVVKQPACNYRSGNHSTNTSGMGCAAEDLCAPTWHICKSKDEVKAQSPTGCTSVISFKGLFFATRQSGPANGVCGTGTNDIYGCGTLGNKVTSSSCQPLDMCSGNLCSALGSPWSCGSSASAEAKNVTKSSHTKGGVLCCKD